jgi:hypothetical protein
MDTLFWLGTLGVLPVWLLMIALPDWAGTRRLVQAPAVVALPALLYLLLALTQLAVLVAATAQLSPAGLVNLFGTSAGATLAWLHMLTLDLFAGRWIYLDSRERTVPAWPVAGALLLTWLMAPLGLVLYLGMRRLWDRAAPSSKPGAAAR